MARSQDELRQIFNSGTAKDADMDEYINAGYDYNVLGPKSKALYDQRKSLIQSNSSPSVTTANADTPTAEETVQPSEEELAKQKTKAEEEKRKELRATYKDDNAGYLKALTDTGISTPDRSKGYNIKSIQQAYYDGTIDKSTRDYMMADAIAKFARNTGRDIGNIGAQFTGGSIDTNREEADWNKRNEALFNNKVTAEQAKQEGTEANIKRQKDTLELEKANKGLSASRLMSGYKNDALAKAKELENKGEKVKAEIMRGIAGEFALLESGSLSGVDNEEHIANAAATIAKAVANDLITKEDADKMKSVLAGFTSVSPTVNVNAGIENPLKDLISRSNKDYNPEAIERANQVDSEARQNGEISLSLYRNPDLAYRALVQKLDPRIVEEFGEGELKNWLDAGNNNLTPTAAAELLKEIYSQYNRENLRATPINRNSRDTFEQSVNRNNAREWNPN